MGGGGGGGDAGVAKQLSKELRQNKRPHVEYYASCTLRFETIRKFVPGDTGWKNMKGRGNDKGSKGGTKKWNRRGGYGDDDDEDEEEDDEDEKGRGAGEAGATMSKVFLQLTDPGGVQGFCIREGDLWVLGTGLSSTQPGAR